MKNTILSVLANDKLILTNGAVFTLSLTNIEMVLKLVLLSVSIVWTTVKIYKEIKNKKQDNERKD